MTGAEPCQFARCACATGLYACIVEEMKGGRGGRGGGGYGAYGA